MPRAFTLTDLRRACRPKLGATTDYPFGEDVLAFRVGRKIFALCILERKPFQFNLKCDPELAEILRHAYPRTVRPGYHMNKRHWITVVPNGGLTSKQILRMIDHSYDCVVRGLSVAARRVLGRVRRH